MTSRIIGSALAIVAVSVTAAAGIRSSADDARPADRDPSPTQDTTPHTSDIGWDGTVVATDDGRFSFLWNGGKQRIQQPAAFDHSHLARAGLSIGTAGAAPPDRR